MTRLDTLLVADGASVHTRRLAVALRDRGLRVGIAAFEGDPIDGVRWADLGDRPVGDDRRYLIAIPRLARAIRGAAPAIVHGHYVSSYGLLAALARRMAHPRGGPRLVQTAWGTDLLVTAASSGLRRRMASIALRGADLITADSADLEAAAAGLAPGRAQLRFVFGPPEALFEVPRTLDRVVLSSRRLDPDMRVDLVIRAFVAARRTGTDLDGWRLVVAGTGSEATALQRLAANDPSIEFVGQLAPADLASLLATSAVYVSAPVSDATSAALLEAMAAGATPVVNDLPANREWVDEAIGVIAPHDPTVEQLAGAIVEGVRREPDPAMVRARVRETTWERQVDILVAAYERLGLLAAGPTTAAPPGPAGL